MYQSADNLFFELYNEPPHMNPDIWKDAAYQYRYRYTED